MLTFSFIWPIALAVLSNIVYHVCSKSTPEGVSPFTSLTVTYLVGAVSTFVLALVTGSGRTLVKDFTRLNWASYVLGIVIVGLEVGFMYAYKAGWEISTASLVQSAFLSAALVFVGFFLYKESLTWNKLVGIAVVLIGLFFINMKKK